MKDDDLDKILSSWQPETPHDPRFRSEVWRKIDRLEDRITLRKWLSETILFLTRPVIGVPAALAAIAISASIAVDQGTSRKEEIWTQLASSYQQSIDPTIYPIR